MSHFARVTQTCTRSGIGARWHKLGVYIRQVTSQVHTISLSLPIRSYCQFRSEAVIVRFYSKGNPPRVCFRGCHVLAMQRLPFKNELNNLHFSYTKTFFFQNTLRTDCLLNKNGLYDCILCSLRSICVSHTDALCNVFVP